MADDEQDLELNELEADPPQPEPEEPEPPAEESPPAEAGETGVAAEDGLPGEGEDAPQATASDLQAVYEIPVRVSAVLGTSNMQVSQLLKLGRGAVVELDRKVGEAIDIYVNNRLVARGEVVVDDERLGVTMTEIIKSDGSARAG